MSKDEDCKDCGDHVAETDARYKVLIERIRDGHKLGRRDRAEITTWLLLRCADYLIDLNALLSAPSELPQDLSHTEQEG
jgi:hypothetical protein